MGNGTAYREKSQKGTNKRGGVTVTAGKGKNQIVVHRKGGNTMKPLGGVKLML